MAGTRTRQQIGAEQTQRVIVEAAGRLFFERGYHATSIGQIAAEAGVAIQTIYNSIGSKRDLLARVLDSTAAGDRAAVLDFAAAGDPAAAADRAAAEVPQSTAERTPDPERIISELVEFWRGALPRTAPVFGVIREAAGNDPEVAGLERERTANRLADYEAAAGLLERGGALRDGLTVRRAAATIFAIGHSEVYRALVIEGQWDDSLWGTWARNALKAALLRG